MNQYLKDIEAGKKIIRSKYIDFTVFKTVVSSYLHNAKVLDEDYWVDLYNSYAGCVGREKRYQELPEWIKEFFQDFNKEEHRVWLNN